MAKQDLKFLSENPVRSLAPVVRASASANGTGIDIREYEAAQMLVFGGEWTDGVATVSLQDSPDDITYTNVAADNLEFTADTVVNASGQVVVQSSATENLSRSVGYAGDEPYLRAQITVGTATTGAIVGADIQRGFKKLKGKLNQ